MSDTQNFDTDALSVKSWFITLFVLAIPLVNLIMLLVWAFTGSGNLGRRNYCRAVLIWIVIVFVLSLGMALLGGAAMMSMDPEALQMQMQPAP